MKRPLLLSCWGKTKQGTSLTVVVAVTMPPKDPT